MEPKTHFIVSTAPHIKAEEGIPDIMKWVAIALAPAFGVALYTFGWYALAVAALCVATCVLTEAICQKLRGKPVTIDDWSAVVTGLLLAAILPPNVVWWIPVVGGVFAMGVAKHAFGGLGNNIWNPALLARAFLQLACGTHITYPQWPHLRLAGITILDRITFSMNHSFEALQALSQPVHAITDPTNLRAMTPEVVTGATHLQRLADISAGAAPSASVPVQELLPLAGETYASLVSNAFLGTIGGSIAETSAIALLVGGLFLLFKKIIRWEIPVAYLGTVGLLAWLLPAPLGGGVYSPWATGPWLYHLVSGGLMIGAFFMATDMVTSPMTRTGQLIFGIGCGVLTVVIRIYSSAYPEGVCYSILLMNTCVPLIDAWTRPKRFGSTPPRPLPSS